MDGFHRQLKSEELSKQTKNYGWTEKNQFIHFYLSSKSNSNKIGISGLSIVFLSNHFNLFPTSKTGYKALATVSLGRIDKHFGP
jgi:hypothetical protein